MSQIQVKDSDIAILIAAIQNSMSPIRVDAEKIAAQLGMSLASIPPKFTGIRKRYNIDITVLNAGALQRNRGGINGMPKKRKSTDTQRRKGRVNSRSQLSAPPTIVAPVEFRSGSESSQ